MKFFDRSKKSSTASGTSSTKSNAEPTASPKERKSDLVSLLVYEGRLLAAAEADCCPICGQVASQRLDNLYGHHCGYMQRLIYWF